MKILVPYKRVPDAGTADAEGATWVVNPFDEIALEEALRIRERGDATEVVSVTIATAIADEQARATFAMGADRAVRVDDPRLLDSYAIARILAAVVRKEQPRLVIMGKQAIDDDANQAGQMLAGLLQWPQATFISKLDIIDQGERIRSTRETDRGIETISTQLPSVVTTDLRLNEPRYVSLPGLMKARRRTVEVLTCAQLGVDVRSRTQVVKSSPARRRRPGERVHSVEDLLVRLRKLKEAL